MHLHVVEAFACYFRLVDTANLHGGVFGLFLGVLVDAFARTVVVPALGPEILPREVETEVAHARSVSATGVPADLTQLRHQAIRRIPGGATAPTTRVACRAGGPSPARGPSSRTAGGVVAVLRETQPTKNVVQGRTTEGHGATLLQYWLWSASNTNMPGSLNRGSSPSLIEVEMK